MHRLLTSEVVTFPYRAPELTWGYKNYTDKVDIWSVGCIFVELLIGKVLFAQKDSKDQINFMYDLLGDPREKWPEVEQLTYWKELKPRKNHINRLRAFLGNFRRDISELGVDLLNRFFDFNPNNRITAREALNHPFF